MNSMLIKLPVALAMLALVGCASTQSTPPKVQGCKTYDEQRRDGDQAAMVVSVLSPELAAIIGVESVRTRVMEVGLPQINVGVYNCTDMDVALIFRSQFAGPDGPTEPETAWKTILLPPRGRVVYRENGVSPKTTEIAVEIHDKNRGQSQFAPGQVYQKP